MTENKIKLYDIEYDTDGEDVELPDEIITTLEEMGWDAENDKEENIEEFVINNGADHISDKTGWLVETFSVEIIKG